MSTGMTCIGLSAANGTTRVSGAFRIACCMPWRRPGLATLPYTPPPPGVSPPVQHW
jgi:hypothetical protein